MTSPTIAAISTAPGMGAVALVRVSGPDAWTDATQKVFPNARFYHKCGLIEKFGLEIAAVDDSRQGGPVYLLSPAVAAGSATKPVGGSQLVGEMSLKIAEWIHSDAATSE